MSFVILVKDAWQRNDVSYDVSYTTSNRVNIIILIECILIRLIRLIMFVITDMRVTFMYYYDFVFSWSTLTEY